MDNSTNMTEKLVPYLDGELTAEERADVNARLQQDSLLAGDYESLLLTREAVQLYGLRQQVAGIHAQMMEQLKAPVRKIGQARKVIRYSIAVAASVILLVAGIWGYNFYTLSSNKVFTAYYQPYENASFREGNNNQSAIEQAYAAKDYKKVTSLKTGTVTAREDLLTALSMVELKQDGAAINEFKSTIGKSETTGESQVTDAAEYYLALTYVRNGDYDLALELFRKIRDDKQHTYNGKVTAKLIRQVKLLKWR